MKASLRNFVMYDSTYMMQVMHSEVVEREVALT